MKLLNTKIQPALIVSSVLFWFVLFVAIYILLMLYWIHKMFFSGEKNVTKHEAGVTAAGVYTTKLIYRTRLRRYFVKNKPFGKL